MQIHVEVVARAAGVLPDEALRVGLVDRLLQLHLLDPELAAAVNVGRSRAHCEADDQRAFNQLMRVVAQDFAIFAGAWFTFVGVYYEVGVSGY